MVYSASLFFILVAKRFILGNATTEDLWLSLGEASGQDVSGLMVIYSPSIPQYNAHMQYRELGLRSSVSQLLPLLRNQVNFTLDSHVSSVLVMSTPKKMKRPGGYHLC